MNNPWLYRPARRPHATARLFCFPHAGASAAVYRFWPNGLPADLEVCAVQLPGRGARLHEAPIASIPVLVDALRSALRPHLDLPFAFFGHSMGALLARELARSLAAHGDPLPRHLLVSGTSPPWMERSESPMSQLSDADFIDELRRRYDGIPPEVMQHADLLALVLPCLRADIHAIETFEPAMPEALPCPLTAYGGADDTGVTRADLEAWHTETTGPFSVRVFPGDHFYLEARREYLVADVAATLWPMLREARARVAMA